MGKYLLLGEGLMDSVCRICSRRSGAFLISDQSASAAGFVGALFKGAEKEWVGIGEEFGDSRDGLDDNDDGRGRDGGIC